MEDGARGLEFESLKKSSRKSPTNKENNGFNVIKTDVRHLLQCMSYFTSTSKFIVLIVQEKRHLHGTSLLFSCGSDGKASAYNAGDLGSIPGMGRSTGEGNDKPLQNSCLENPMDRGAW